MGIELYKHNAIAYEKVKEMFKTNNRACVIHPTGCGKSFIGLKWLEENKEKSIIYVAPNVSILRQIAEHIQESGMSMKDFPFLKRYTYSKLSKMTSEEISKIKVDGIIFDEFHRCGAKEWNKRVEELINNNSNVKILGFSATPIRYLDEHRNMAEELFNGNIASEISLEEAIINGILPIPTYINAIYSFQEDIQYYENRIQKEARKDKKIQAEEYLEEAKKILEKADGLPEIFEKHMRNKAGKYIVFCRNENHMKKMIEESKKWFQNVNDQIDTYSMASFIKKSENLKVFDEFYHSDNNHLKLLFSIDMLNEGIHVPNIDGVIMLRPTESPIIFKQQLGRALSVGHNRNPLIFDIVKNIQSCEMISQFSQNLEQMVIEKSIQMPQKEDTPKGEDKRKIEAFKVSDTVRKIQEIFKAIDSTLSLSWDDYYQLAKQYYEENGNLLIPSDYRINDVNLGAWIGAQRSKYKGIYEYKNLSEEQVEKLNAIKMVWSPKEEQWNINLKEVEKFLQKTGRLPVATSRDEKESFLGRWIGTQRMRILKEYSDKSEEEIPEKVKRKIKRITATRNCM